MLARVPSMLQTFRAPSSSTAFLLSFSFLLLLLVAVFLGRTPSASFRVMLHLQSSFNFLMKVPFCPISLPGERE